MYHREFGDGGGWGDGGAATVGVVGAAHRELGGEQHHGEHRAAPGQLRTKIFLAMKLIRWSEHWLYSRQTNWRIFDLFTNLESLFVKSYLKTLISNWEWRSLTSRICDILLIFDIPINQYFKWFLLVWNRDTVQSWKKI